MSDNLNVDGANDPLLDLGISLKIGELITQTAVEVVRAQGRAALSSAPIYDSRVIGLPADETVMLLPYHAKRIRFMVKATTGNILLGNPGNLASNSGWQVGTSGSDEFRTVEDVYVRSVGGQGSIYLYAEYDAE